jgi:FlaA1/EpsC-like NDP-sugar epimerase
MPLRLFSSRRYNLKLIWHRLVAYFLDWCAFALSGLLAFELRFDGALPANYLHPMEVVLCIWVVAKSAAFVVAKLDRGNWRYTSAYDAVRIVLANSAGSMLSGVVIFFLPAPWGIPRSVYILDWLVSCLLTLGGRLAVRVVITARKAQRSEGDRTKTLIYGAGRAGLALLWELHQNPSLMCEVVGLIDDDPSKAHLILQGRPVLGTGDSLGDIVRANSIKRVLIAIPTATGPQMVRILKFALDAEVEYKMVPSLGDLIQGTELGQQIRDVAVEDLLGRRPVRLDQDSIRERIRGRVVRVTGAAGSIGSELCRQIAQFHPLALVGFDEAETPLFQLDRELTRCFPDLVFHPEIGNITRPDILRRVMEYYEPSILYHAAAYKHVPMMERHVFAAVENNILGTWQVALAAARHGVEDFVMISTDKAVRPTSIMGATKRTAELAIRALQKERGTKFVAVRFGNVLGSNGSVVPIFKDQIAVGGPVTVTHPEMRRYFMTISEAAQLVLQAFAIGKGGEVFVLDMGEPVKIVDLARNLILLSGLQPDKDIKIQFTGMRPGEKLFEELNLQDEDLVTTSHAKIRSYVSPYNVDAMQIKACMQDLQQAVSERDTLRIVRLLKELIPDYTPGSKLMKSVVAIESNHAESSVQVLTGQSESVLSANIAASRRMN